MLYISVLLAVFFLVTCASSQRESEPKNTKEEFIERLSGFTEPNEQGLIGITAERHYPDGGIGIRTVIIDTEKGIWSDRWE